MVKSKSSHRWMERHVNDPYVQRARRDGYRSRAAYKLLEIQQKDRILKPGQRVVDLGAAPGSWSQIAQRVVSPNGTVCALDILPMEPLSGVKFVKGDFREDSVVADLRVAMDGQLADLVMSDMAPNVSGSALVDQPRSIYLCELVFDFAREILRPGGSLVVKIFQGQGFDDYVKTLRSGFGRLATRKPDASRPKSREVYLVAGNYNS